MALSLQHQTGAQFLARLVQDWRGATREARARMAWRIVEMMNAGHITDNQLRNALGLTVVEYAPVKTKLTDLHDKWAAIQGEV